ncbi:signal transduction histidine kinase [Microbacterium resistens]|uniref:histidine kinase n=1 Tax=Microbacterium resistens TaxID=156977 RepID=A0ABU1SAQ5_9MICO|nr:histidine kinase [Microbacterium resistens]MDR6866697.1 signal transduction histidine kinase [Microbacterium resistens]
MPENTSGKPSSPTGDPASASPLPVSLYTEERIREGWQLIRTSAARRPPTVPALGWISLAVALVLTAVSTAVNASISGVPVVAALAGAVLQCGSIALAVVMPRLAIVAHAAGIMIVALTAATGTGAPWPLPVPGMIAMSAFLLVLALREPWPLPATGFLAAFGAALFSVALRPDADPAWSIDIAVASQALVVMVLGIGIAQWRIVRGELRDAQAATEVEVGRVRWATERRRIAREMHDVVAHSMSIVHMQASSAVYRHPGLPIEVAEEFDGIAVRARSALTEMRQLLGVLRDEGEQLTAPQPTLADLDELVERSRTAGVRVTAQIALPDPLPDDAVQLAVYRAAQEGLSNTVRHAPGSNVRVILEEERSPGGERRLLLEVIDDGTGARSIEQSGRSGLGIAGMQERVGLVGGSVVAGPRGRGWAVVVQVPLTEESA